jgi:outer membrane protein
LYANREVEQEKSKQMGEEMQLNVVDSRTGERASRKVRVIGNLRTVAVTLLAFSTAMPPGFAQQTAPQAGDKVLKELPAAPAPIPTEPLFMRDTQRDFSKPPHGWSFNPIGVYRPTTVPEANFMNSLRMGDLVKDGKIYLSLSDALTLALENNYDLAIARYNLDIADTDLLRAKAGSVLRGVNSGIVANTLGGTSQTITVGGGPGGTSAGAATGSSGLVVSTDGAGPLPENLDPYITTAIQFDRQRAPSSSFFSGGTSSTNTYNFGFNEGFVTGTNLAVTFNNSYATTTNEVNTFSPLLNASYMAQLTQHVLQGAGIWVNKRFQQEAIYDRRITDSAFRQQILYTVNQIENIYWALVSSYEDLQAKERAVEQSSKVAADDRKQLEIGTMAPLDVVTADSAVAADKQALISSQSNLQYQQLIMKQAIARNLNDPALIAAPIIPTDRASLEELPEEKQTADELAKVAFQQRPELEQAVLSIKKDEITLRGAKNALLPVFDVFAYLGGSGLAGTANPNCTTFCPPPLPPTTGYGTAFENTFNNSAPDKGIGFNLNIPLRNRTAQADQARSIIEYRQAQLRLEQLYTEIKMQVINQQYALTNDRAAVLAAEASQKFNAQSLDSEEKKLHLGASTTSLVLQQSRNLATAENSLTAARAAYAKDRASLYQLLATTLQHYGINLSDAAAGVVKQVPVIPGLEAAQQKKEPVVPTADQQKDQTQQIKKDTEKAPVQQPKQ